MLSLSPAFSRFESLRELYNGELEVMAILITDSDGCEKYPHMDMDESCKFICFLLLLFALR